MVKPMTIQRSLNPKTATAPGLEGKNINKICLYRIEFIVGKIRGKGITSYEM